ncbi:hypothetical protein ENUP19_0252G0057 [Entamoeba nuttalli]|uniref:Membrane-spanning protein, putative n=2 Tax=Entamoeba nuttalli TaxID=412467 RepID=K2HNB3_ENTNP|nr:membrane-spanning protein, putative [Entamoeba nuttalli P19]EKE37350.1 membrane-spanning protein, putative [Entamoeba nuttalli P19]|eukprot:XP_008860305.1 membrane-spanning protein, putative [Entamoeba nuttalli P19]
MSRNQNIQTPPFHRIQIKKKIQTLLKNDIFGYEKEIHYPISKKGSSPIQQSVNLTQQIVNENTIPQSVKSFIQTPFYLERSVLIGLLISWDTFSSFLLFTPLRIISYFYQLIFVNEKVVIHYKRIYDILMYLSTLFCVIIIYQVDIGFVYHYIRAESVLKLYALYNALGMLNSLLSAFTFDIHSSLLISIKNKKLYDSILFFILTVFITLLHSFNLFFYIMALNVAINSKGHALLALLVSNNILELKSSVWKRMFPENVFQVLCADILELFELFSFVILLSLSNFGYYEWDIESNPDLLISMIYSLFLILLAEVIIDSLKHMFIGKFNNIPLSIYDKGKFVLLNDLISTQDGLFKIPSLDSTSTSARRLGMPAVPLSVLFICFGLETIPPSHFNLLFIISLLLILYLFKILLAIALRYLAFAEVTQHTYESDDLVTVMKGIARYVMEKGRIPQ